MKFFYIAAIIVYIFYSAVSSVGVVDAAEGEITLKFNWEYPGNLDDVEGFKLYSRTPGAEYDFTSPVIVIPKSSTGGNPELLGHKFTTTNEHRFYVMTSFAGDKESGLSNEVEYRPIVDPKAPVNLKVTVEFVFNGGTNE